MASGLARLLRSRSSRQPIEETLSRRLGRHRGGLVAVALLALLGLTGLAVALAWRQYEDGRRDAISDVRSRAVLAATVFDTYFAGQLATLNAIADAPSVRAADVPAMRSYFARVQPANGKLFTGGLGWLDRAGVPRASSNPGVPANVNVSDRSYFRQVVGTGKPFISEALVTRASRRRVIVMAVPTRDSAGRIAGVLTGSLLLQQSPTNQRSIDLGYAGLNVIDRKGQQLTDPSLSRPDNVALLRRLRERPDGVIADTHGLDDGSGRVVGYARSPVAGWLAVLDEPASSVFARARRSFELEIASVAAAGLIGLFLIGWAVRRSRRELKTERGRIRRWARLTRSLTEAKDTDEVSTVLASALVEELPDATVVVGLRAPDAGGLFVRALVVGPRGPGEDEIAPAARTVAELADAADSGVVAADGAALRRDVPELADVHGARSLYAVALAGDSGDRVGSVSILLAREEPLDADTQSFVHAHADQARAALGRLRRHQQEHDAVILLQRSLLPQALPDVEGLELAGRYEAGAREMEVGGDWYDAVRRPDGIVHVSVGDVAGRGIHAAVLMGQLRNAFRAYALDNTSPAVVVERLARHVDPGHMVTMVCATFDPCTSRLEYASAGHPPALLVDGEHVTRLDRTGRPPLGWPVGPATRVVAESVDMPRGSVVAFYTDGLVERRDRSIDDGIAVLERTLAERLPLGTDRAASDAVERLVGPNADDDTALLLMQNVEVPASLDLQIDARPTLLAGLRRRLRAWLALRGLDERQVDDALLVISEACNNAIEHGYREQADAVIRLELRHGDGVLEIAVEDEGVWRHPEPRPGRGRGLVIMETLMLNTSVDRKPGGGTRVALEQKL